MAVLIPVRVYLTGHVCIESGEMLLDGWGGKQGRLAVVYLVVERARAVTRDELARALWQDDLPDSWDASLSAVISNLRTVMARIGLERTKVIEQAFGCYQLRLPAALWVDVEAAAQAIDEAEGALKAGDSSKAHGLAGVATAIARRPFLQGQDGRWIERQRRLLRDILLRRLDCFTQVLARNGETQQAVRAAAEAVDLEPYRETGYRLLMKAHAADGNRAESLRVYERCRTVLAEELGIDPSPQTEAVYLDLLR